MDKKSVDAIHPYIFISIFFLSIYFLTEGNKTPRRRMRLRGFECRANIQAPKEQVNQKNEYDFRHPHSANLRQSFRLFADALTIFPPCQHLPLVRLAPRHTAIPMVRE